MGLDVGSKTIGVSLSDPMRVTTSPLTTLQRTSIDTDCEQLLEIANHHMVAGIVIGLPRNMDGSRSETERLIPPILKYLRLSNIDVDLQDERLSTKAAEKKMAQENYLLVNVNDGKMNSRQRSFLNGTSRSFDGEKIVLAHFLCQYYFFRLNRDLLHVGYLHCTPPSLQIS